MEKKNILQKLGKRSYKSLVGNAVIGVIGGVIIWVITLFRGEPKTYKMSLENWISVNLIDPSTSSLNYTELRKYYLSRVVDSSRIDTIINILKTNSEGGATVSEFQNKRILDSVLHSNSINNLDNGTQNQHSYYYINSLEHTDFLMVLKDSLIDNVISLPNPSNK
jgi:hypothetical protein